MNPATTRLEVVSELVESPEPLLNQTVVKEPGKPDLHDDVTIGLGSLLAVRGKAFAVNGQNALVLWGVPVTEDRAIPVVKEFRKLEDGRKFIIESVGWQESEPLLKALPAGGWAANSQPSEKPATDSRIWPKRVTATRKQEPLQVAALPYKGRGMLVDLDLVRIPSSNSAKPVSMSTVAAFPWST